jgi:hypothetical protein
LFKNFWDVTLEFETKPIAPVDFYQLDEWNKRLQTLPYYFTGIYGSSDSRKKLFWSFGSSYGFSNQVNASYLFLEQGIRYLLGQKVELNMNGNITRDHSNIGYSYFDEINEAPIVARRNVHQYTAEIGFKINIDPNTNFTGRFRHYNAIIINRSFHVVNELGAWQHSTLPYTNYYDENYNLKY